jgi:hypothetical protein
MHCADALHSCTHALQHSCTHALMHSFTHALMHSCTPALMHSFTPALIHSTGISSRITSSCPCTAPLSSPISACPKSLVLGVSRRRGQQRILQMWGPQRTWLRSYSLTTGMYSSPYECASYGVHHVAYVVHLTTVDHAVYTIHTTLTSRHTHRSSLVRYSGAVDVYALGIILNALW